MVVSLEIKYLSDEETNNLITYVCRAIADGLWR